MHGSCARFPLPSACCHVGVSHAPSHVLCLFLNPHQVEVYYRRGEQICMNSGPRHVRINHHGADLVCHPKMTPFRPLQGSTIAALADAFGHVMSNYVLALRIPEFPLLS